MKSIAAGALLLALLAVGCDRDRSNPLDPQADLVQGRPATPAEVSARGEIGRIRLAWQPVTDPDLAGYAVLRSDRSNGTFTFVSGEGDSTAGITTGKTTFDDTIRGEIRTFFYRVAAVDTSGLRSELSGFVGATSLADERAPESPHSVSAVASETPGEVVVRWSAPESDAGGEELSGLSGYVVLRSEGTGGSVALDTLSRDERAYRDTGLKSRTTYSYSVVAIDGSGNASRASAPVSVTTSGLPSPSDLRAASGIGRIELSRWPGMTCIARRRRTGSIGAWRGRRVYVDSNLPGGLRPLRTSGRRSLLIRSRR
jgi:hypothetical protein